MKSCRGDRILQVASETPAPKSEPEPNQLAYSLRRGLGCWELVFKGQRAVLKEQVGLLYAAWLLHHPHDDPVHGVVLRAAAREGWTESHPELLPAERSLGLDEWAQRRKWLARLRTLAALLEDPNELPLIKAEAERESAELEVLLASGCRQSEDAAQRASRAVRKALVRLVADLDKAQGSQGSPHTTLREFGQHLRRYLLIPSVRYAGRSFDHARTGLAGRFCYEPPEGVTWGI